MKHHDISPLGIRMLIHFYAFPEPWSELSKAAADLMTRFEDDGLICSVAGHEGDPWFRRLTERGVRYVEMLCATPLPERVTRYEWVDPRGYA